MRNDRAEYDACVAHNRAVFAQKALPLVPDGWEVIYTGHIKEGDMTWAADKWVPLGHFGPRGLQVGEDISRTLGIMRKKA